MVLASTVPVVMVIIIIIIIIMVGVVVVREALPLVVHLF
jgi:hypothetical protein